MTLMQRINDSQEKKQTGLTRVSDLKKSIL